MPREARQPHFPNMARTGRKVPMSYKSDREAFVFRMAIAGGQIGLPDVREILAAAGVMQRAAEVDCSVSDEAMRAHATAAATKAAKKIRAALAGTGWSAQFHGDPRGCVVHLTHATHNEIGVPAQGYSARQMERMGSR